MKLSALIDAVGIDEFAHPFGRNASDIEITGIACDSRKVEKGTLFVALDGVEIDGAHYIPQAIEAGASAVVTHLRADVSNTPVPLAQIGNPRLALSRLAAAFYSSQPETIVAVTGTAGKTSVASFVRQLWEMQGKEAASIGTTGVHAFGQNKYGSLTTPDPVDLHRLLEDLSQRGVSHGAMEASSHGLDQYRLDGVRLAAAGFTNLGRDHMDYHPSVEHYFQSKMRLFNSLLPEGAPAVVFADDAWSAKAMETVRKAGRQVLSVGRQGDYISLKRVEHGQFDQIAEISHGGANYRVAFPLAGDFQIANGLVAAGLAIVTGSDAEKTIQGLANLKGASGRLELVGRSVHQAPCYVDYAHKPEALENVLNSLRPFTTGKLVCVFGCGGDRDPGKRPMMGEIAQRLADEVIVTDDNPRTEDPALVRAQILAAAPKAREIGDRGEAIETAVLSLEEGDCLVVAGKGHETGQTIGTIVHPFSDHEVLGEALAANGGSVI